MSVDGKLQRAWDIGGRITNWPAEHLDRIVVLIQRTPQRPAWLRQAQAQVDSSKNDLRSDASVLLAELIAERFGSDIEERGQ